MIITSLVNALSVQAVRTWLKEQPEGAGGWLGALRDPTIGAALGLIHRSPHVQWTGPVRCARCSDTTGLPDPPEVGTSRSPFAARFTASVGITPMSYLKRWRLQLATRLLQNPVLTLGEVSERVGYESVEAFSRVFSREFGIAPGQYRRAQAVGNVG